MLRRSAIGTLALAVALASTTPLQAQIGVYNRPQTNPRPTVSPYLSIFRGSSGSGVINYYGVVRPQFETNRQLQMLQQGAMQAPFTSGLPVDPLQQLQMQQLQMQQLQQPAVSTTGHPVSFFNYSHYYGSRTGSSGGGVAGGFGNPTGTPNLNLAPFRPLIVGTANQ